MLNNGPAEKTFHIRIPIPGLKKIGAISNVGIDKLIFSCGNKVDS